MPVFVSVWTQVQTDEALYNVGITHNISLICLTFNQNAPSFLCSCIFHIFSFLTSLLVHVLWMCVGTDITFGECNAIFVVLNSRFNNGLYKEPIIFFVYYGSCTVYHWASWAVSSNSILVWYPVYYVYKYLVWIDFPSWQILCAKIYGFCYYSNAK